MSTLTYSRRESLRAWARGPSVAAILARYHNEAPARLVQGPCVGLWPRRRQATYHTTPNPPFLTVRISVE